MQFFWSVFVGHGDCISDSFGHGGHVVDQLDMALKVKHVHGMTVVLLEVLGVMKDWVHGMARILGNFIDIAI